MKNIGILITIAAFFLAANPGEAASASYTVPATSDIFDAGRSAPIIPVGGAGTLPVQIAFTPTQVAGFQFTYLGGTVSQYYNDFSLGPEGLAAYESNINPYDGISGFLANHQFPLVGVFLTDATPQSPSPPTLDFTTAGIGENFSSLRPGIGQVFYIGDGRTDSGQIQTFYPPSTATRLFLGFADAPYGAGDPGNYNDNEGALDIEVTNLPSPGVQQLFQASIRLLMTTTNDVGRLESHEIRNKDVIRHCAEEQGITNLTGLSLVYNRTADALEVVSGTNDTLVCTPISFMDIVSLNKTNVTLGNRLAFVFVGDGPQASGTLWAVERCRYGPTNNLTRFILNGHLQYAESGTGTNTAKIYSGSIYSAFDSKPEEDRR